MGHYQIIIAIDTAHEQFQLAIALSFFTENKNTEFHHIMIIESYQIDQSYITTNKGVTLRRLIVLTFFRLSLMDGGLRYHGLVDSFIATAIIDILSALLMELSPTILARLVFQKVVAIG